MTTTVEALLKDSAYNLGQFTPAHINALQASVTMKDAAKKP
ncbi:MAG: restriction endonuclease subunit R, partial [Burkholderiales bacterium PBB5]